MKRKTRTIAQTLFKRKLKPAITTAPDDTIVVTNGFSCREQIEDGTGRKVMHPVQVIERCIGTGTSQDAT